MNRLCYRLIFNRARGLIMAVAEIVKPMGTGKCRAAGAAASFGRLGVTLRGIVWASWCALAGPASMAEGIVADPNAAAAQRPGVIKTANGLPQVNIQAPGAAGVSRNQYSQFDVNRGGAILNNSATSVQTQLGGWIQGNPNLNGAAAPARVILNEVNSANPSQLRGFLEVAGGRAQVIVANPAGIVCDGCGTINAGRMTLTTGRPELNPDGSLAGYRVERGTIRIEGSGMQAGSTEYADLMARAVEVQAGIWAQNLAVSAGRNRVSADHQSIQPLAAADAVDKPGFAIDVAQLGGMYAGKIRLLATEAGVGVRSSGQMNGREQLVLDSAGRLSLSGRQNGGEIQYRAAGDIDHDGASYSQSRLSVNGEGALRHGGTLAAAGDMQVQAQRLEAGGDFAAGSDMDGRVGASGTLSLKADQRLQLSGHALAGSALTLGAAAIDAADAKLRAGDRIDLSAGDGVRLSRAVLNTGRLSVRAGGGLDSDGATVQASQWQVQAGALNNRGGAWEQIGHGSGAFRIGRLLDNREGRIEADSLELTLGQLDNGGGKLLALGRAAQAWTVQDAFNNQGGQLGSNGNLSLQAGSLDNADGAVQSAGMLALQVKDAARNHGGKLLAADALKLVAGSVDNGVGGRIDAGQGLVLTTSGSLDNRAGQMTGAGIELQAGDMDNANGAIESRAGLALSVQGALDNRHGKLLSEQAQAVKAGKLDNDEGEIGSRTALELQAGAASNQRGRIVSLGDGDIQLDTLNNANGKLQSGGALSLQAQGSVDNQQGRISAQRAMRLDGGALRNQQGMLAAGERIAVRAGQMDNQGGTVASQQGLTLNLDTLDNRDGQIQTVGQLTLDAGGLLDNRGGKLVADQGQRLRAGELNNQRGLVSSGQALSMDGGALHNQQGRLLSRGNAS
ncbi:filamentous hemagglutinin N-terminal domain-containing protein, partial [Chromobacterium vaccinii]|uniref:two-partner secretion domain-containing protein n=1 Tax=Chromobacterium vaccinii TaxID=1108595 RepID=UPI003C721008